MNELIRGLSFIQPYATAIMLGHKKIETRSFPTHYRGRIAVHASVGFPKWAVEFAQTERAFGRIPARIPLGQIVGLATIADCRHAEDMAPAISGLERLYGDYSFGRFAWVLCDIVAFPEPIPCKGSLGLWKVPQEILEQIEKAVKS